MIHTHICCYSLVYFSRFVSICQHP